VFEGARLIAGDGSAPSEDAAFLVENGRVTQVGRRGQITIPAGAVRVDLTGKTVMPGIVDAHRHPGFLDAFLANMSKAEGARHLDHTNLGGINRTSLIRENGRPDWNRGATGTRDHGACADPGARAGL